jgi:hypothetical protein
VTEFLPPLAPYPRLRLCRNRRDAWSRKLVGENVLTSGDLIWPVLVHDEGRKQPIASMPGVFRLPIPALVDAAARPPWHRRQTDRNRRRHRPRARLPAPLLDNHGGQCRRSLTLRPRRPFHRLHPLRLPARLNNMAPATYCVSRASPESGTIKYTPSVGLHSRPNQYRMAGCVRLKITTIT